MSFVIELTMVLRQGKRGDRTCMSCALSPLVLDVVRQLDNATLLALPTHHGHMDFTHLTSCL
jgi:hypothetical protein